MQPKDDNNNSIGGVQLISGGEPVVGLKSGSRLKMY